MNNSKKARKSQVLASAMREGAHLLTQTGLDLLVPPDRSSPPQESRRAELGYMVWRLRNLLREAMGEGNDKELAAILSALAENSDQIERAIVVWVDLIEVLVQNAERRYGTKPGRGSIKTAEVKAIVRYLLRTNRLDLDVPSVPGYLMPVIIDIIVDSLIDGIVLISDRYGMWEVTKTSPQSFHAIILMGLDAVYRFFRPLLIRLAWLINRIWFAIHIQVPLSPAIQSALDAVRREGLIASGGEKGLVDGVLDLLVWIGTHGDQIIAAFEIVFDAVQEAETYVTLSGPEKKAFARDLVLAVLDNLGFEERVGLIFAIVDSLVSGSIEATVHLFNKHSVFPHRSSAL